MNSIKPMLCCFAAHLLLGHSNLSYTQVKCDFRASNSRDASWSPDGTKLVFDSNMDGNREIYIMNSDGTGIKRLTHTESSEYYPFYSPDGSKIVFMSLSGETNVIYVMDSDGRNLTPLTEPKGVNADPHWSPDGKKIAFFSERDGNAKIYVMDANGKNPKRLTNNSATETTPAWSPDGKQICFISTHNGNDDVYVMNADGTNQRRVTKNPMSDRVARWSPDGESIIFYGRIPTSRSSSRSASWASAEIFTVKLDGTARKQLTHNNHLDQAPVYSPDGTKIAFTSCRSGNREIYVMEATGENERRLTFSIK